jgi:hypothetical protein
MKRITSSLTSMLLIFLILLSSCDKEDSNKKNIIEIIDSCYVDGQIITGYVKIPRDSCVDLNYGTVDLSPCSFKSIPYKTDTLLVFKDSLNNEVNYNLIAQKNNLYYRTSTATLYCNWNKDYPYTIEGKSQALEFYLFADNNESDFGFGITLSVDNSIKSNELVFKENIIVVKYDTYGNQLNYTLICLYPKDPEIGEKRSFFYHEKLLHDKIFQNVYGSWEKDLFYNYKYGLIGFRDNNYKLWVLMTK